MKIPARITQGSNSDRMTHSYYGVLIIRSRHARKKTKAEKRIPNSEESFGSGLIGMVFASLI